MPIKVGDKLPDVTLYEGNPGNGVKLHSVFAGKKGVLLAVPGAFTPGCSKTHVPGYLENFDKFKGAGADVIACIATNDPFVMGAWAQAQNTGDKIRMLSDMNGEAVKQMDVGFDAMGCLRYRRFSMVIQDNVVKALNLQDAGEMTCSLADPTLEQVAKL
ncbi:peroxiredoxin type II [Dunaliella salina]|uniref:Glutaredoxin-dependent peroxiredoxin n=1 Tax=Dunaliella salina TaxID=3046 RepID=A0ABQ7GB58_DUNSA|nr:peroxiredoxin type II [Dunaliella salina]|eukprot:KAF5831843.1 peroxiredoxin type II [Dunaliella salina]